MLTKLYFLRHGLADWPDWTGADDERPLTPDGIEKMKLEAKAIKRLKLKPDAILSSPLIRARQTADLVADRLGLTVKVTRLLAPGFNIAQLDKLVREADAATLLFVGHEPDFSTTLSQLIGGGHVVMKKGGLARVDITALDPLSGELVWLLAPAVLTND
ncbi:MAG: histidine phosphatase family protein [Chloroflexi bacterium]|nr:histidine phosphatase family protein [Chloroflexota bacterium]